MRNRLFYFFVVCLLHANTNIFAQTCISGTVIFNTQALIDSFPNKYVGCKQIQGNILIAGADITNLKGFKQISTIGGNYY